MKAPQELVYFFGGMDEGLILLEFKVLSEYGLKQSEGGVEAVMPVQQFCYRCLAYFVLFD